MKTLVLIGGGHAHIHVVRTLNASIRKDWEIILVSMHDTQYYSGMASGFLEGYYAEEELTIHLPEYCARYQVKFVHQTAVSVDPRRKSVHLASGDVLHYDVISFNIGSLVEAGAFGQCDGCFFVKPLFQIKEIKKKVVELCGRRGAKQTVHAAIVGTGASGIEVGFAIRELILAMGKTPRITFVGSGDRILNTLDAKAGEMIINEEEESEQVEWALGDAAEKVEGQELVLDSGRRIGFDLLVLATGVRSSELFRESGLQTDAKGFLFVNSYLQNEEYPEIFGAGDCATLRDRPDLPKNGVYAIKEAKVLVKNLERALLGRSLIAYRPQKKYLAILALKENRAILVYDRTVYDGFLPFHIKRGIDTDYMRKVKSQ